MRLTTVAVIAVLVASLAGCVHADPPRRDVDFMFYAKTIPLGGPVEDLTVGQPCGVDLPLAGDVVLDSSVDVNDDNGLVQFKPLRGVIVDREDIESTGVVLICEFYAEFRDIYVRPTGVDVHSGNFWQSYATSEIGETWVIDLTNGEARDLPIADSDAVSISNGDGIPQ